MSINMNKNSNNSSSSNNNNSNENDNSDNAKMSTTYQEQQQKLIIQKRMKEEALGGLSAGLLGTIIGFPLDLIKTRMQTSSSSSSSLSSSSSSSSFSSSAAGSHHRSILRTGYAIVRKEGPLAIYKGIVPPLISLSILNTFTFASYSYFRKSIYGGSDGWDLRNAWSGGTCGMFSGIVSTVENRIKTEMQMDNIHKQRYRGSYQCMMTLIQEGGVFASLYKGHTINMIREMLFLSTYFFVYEGLRHLAIGSIGDNTNTNTNISTTNDHLTTKNCDIHTTTTEKNIKNKFMIVPLVGGCAGATAWFISFPLDCIRAQIQIGPPSSSRKKNGLYLIRTVTKQLYQTKGIHGLYHGVTPSIVRAFLVSGSRFTAYEVALYLLRGGRDHATQ